MKRFITILIMILFSWQAGAQGDGSGRVRNLRVAYITERLNLPPEQNARFWGVYNRYLDERASLRRVYRDQFARGRGGDADGYDANRFIDDNIEYKEKDLELSKKYKAELLRVISAQQLVDLYQAEREFKQMLIEKLRKR
ncbi:MAG: hypothetical protein QM743_09355 [Chitinophagaceae bacterium]